jgi:hypothetical protein
MAITTNFNTAVLALVDDLVTADNIDISKAIYTSTFEVGDIAEGHQIVTGIRPGALIPILDNAPNYGAFPVKSTNNCSIPACDLDLGFSTKAWQTAMIACKIPICINSFDENFLLFWNQHKRIFGDADLNSSLMQYIVDLFQKNLQAAIWRRVWFADSASTNDYLEGADGIFTQAEAMDGFKIEVAENVAGTGLTGAALYAYLTEAYEHASLQPWWNPATARMEMTQAMAAVLVSWLNSMGDRTGINCECYSADGLTAQRTYSVDGMLKIFGITVHVHREFDGVINAFALGNPYRAILTSDTNILIGTTELDQLPAFDIWYSKDDDQIYIKGGANVGAALVTNQYVYIGAETASPSV